MREKLPRGRWSHSYLFTAYDSVYEWGRLPSEFGLNKPENDLSWMSAYIEAKRIMERTEIEIEKEEAERKKLKDQADAEAKK